MEKGGGGSASSFVDQVLLRGGGGGGLLLHSIFFTAYKVKRFQARINYKICVLCFKCINKTAPSYLSDLLEQYVPSRLLRSGSQNLLKIPPRANKKCTEKAFKHCAPYIWNSLPSDIREAKSESQFKNYLKTHLFKSHICI